MRDPFGTRYQIAPGEGAADAALPVVLIHGVGLDSTMWDAEWTALARRLPLVRYDMLGHGGSRAPPRGRRLEDFVSQLHRLLDFLGRKRAAVVGFSMGGLVAQAFALDRPERCERLAILHSVFRRSPEVLAALRERIASNDPDGTLEAYRVFATADRDLGPRLAQIRCPTLVMTGEQDVHSTPAMAAAMAGTIPGAELSIVAGERHMAPIEAAREVNRIVLEFLDRGRAQRRWPRKH